MIRENQWPTNIEMPSFEAQTQGATRLSQDITSTRIELAMLNDAPAAQVRAPQSALPEAGGLRGVTVPRGSEVVNQLDRVAYNRTPAEQYAYELADRILPLPGQTARHLTPAQLEALARDVVGPGMRANQAEFLSYLQRTLRAAGYGNASVTTGTEVTQIPPSHPASAYHPAPIRTPYIELRDRGLQLRIRY